MEFLFIIIFLGDVEPHQGLNLPLGSKPWIQNSIYQNRVFGNLGELSMGIKSRMSRSTVHPKPLAIKLHPVAFGKGESTFLLASKFLGMWLFAIWMPRNVAIPMFDFIGNLLWFLGMWDDNVWLIPKNFKWVIYFSHSIPFFECELPSPLKKIFL